MSSSDSRGHNNRVGLSRAYQRAGHHNNELSFINRTSNTRGTIPLRFTSRFSSTSGSQSHAHPPCISLQMLSDMLEKQPDELIISLTRENFQLDKYLSDDRLKTNFEWLQTLTTLFERILTCLGQEKRIADILIRLPGSIYFDALHDAIRSNDPATDTLRFNLILQTLKIINHLLTINPHAESSVSPFTDRIEICLSRLNIENDEIQTIKQLHKTVVDKAQYIYRQKQEKVQMKKSYGELGPPPDNFHLLKLIPSMNELLSDGPVYLRQNIVEQGGTYENSDHYLDVHFRLLREDFLGPLRDGIKTYLINSKNKNTDIRIYENVYPVGPKLNTRCGLVYGLQLDKKKCGKIQWANSRRLIYGSLLALTANKFQSCIFVTVEDRTNIEKNLILYVRPYIESNDLYVNQDLDQLDLDLLLKHQLLTMIETTSYFEAYRHILRALQKIPAQKFPLAPYILQLSQDITPPDYVNSTTQFDFTPLFIPMKTKVTTFTQLSIIANSSALTCPQSIFRISYEEQNRVNKQYRNVTLLNKDEWPTGEEIQLNEKQHEALMLALTKKVALIQGPPGTGKTFLGVKIAELLLHNRSVWCPPGTENTPILMVCQTNHALDQFLEHIVNRLNMTEGLIRVGGRSKNETILNFALSKVRQYYRQKHFIPSTIHGQKRDIMARKTLNQMTIQGNEAVIDISYRGLTSLSLLQRNNSIKAEHFNSLIGGSGHYKSEDTILNEWLGLTRKVDVVKSIDNEFDQLNIGDIDDEPSFPEEDDEELEEEWRRRDDIDFDEEFFRPTDFTPKISFASNTDDDNNSDNDEGWQTVVDKSKQKQMIYQLLTYRTTLDDETIDSIKQDLWSLTIPERHNLYRYWLQNYRENKYKSVSKAHLELNRAMAEHSQYLQLEDYYILKNAVIVAMTTTGAAKYFDVLQRLGCKIVIVEEAAELFEAHVITSLSPQCEHLILIGDHVQLRPNPSVYKLAVNYKIDVSLFERLVKNNFPNVRLNIQHRMRPELCKLMAHFYNDLKNHESVLTERPSIIGVQKNFFLINHNHPEEVFVEGSSKQNRFEAEYVLALAHFLIKQGYETSQITILVMYLGQRALISRLLKTSTYNKILKGIRIHVTDSYQGEENDIILLSLVRSNNKDNTIGFLKIHNRICVALSRARCGMYIVGNLNFLMAHEEMWEKIGGSLMEENAVGTGLPLCCLQHPNDSNFIADTPSSFDKRPEGGCDKLCESRLACGHACPKFCHNYSHDRVRCMKLCNEPRVTCEHRCQKLCHADEPNNHGICQVLVEKTVEVCQHTIRMACGVEPTSDKCTFMVPVRLPCGHLADVTCAVRTSNVFDKVLCSEPCQDVLLCKHPCSGTCGECKSGKLHLPCKEQCARQLLCSHSYQTVCSNNDLLCLSKCETSCKHSKCQLTCGEPCTPCREPCTNACQHEQCSRACSEPCDREPCKMPCSKIIPKCGHLCIGLCGEPCPPQCRICNKQLVEEYFFGNEDTTDSRFVHLPDCNHIFEVNGLDRYMNDFLTKLTNSSEFIRFPACPRPDCKVLIRHCQRYTSIINRIQLWIEQIKSKQRNSLTKPQLNEQRSECTKKLKYSFDRIKSSDEKSLDILIRRFANTKQSINTDELNYLKNTCEFFKEIDRCIEQGLRIIDDDIFVSTILPSIRYLIVYICKQCDDKIARNYTSQQLNDIQNELKRLRCLINYHILDKRLPQSMKTEANRFPDMKMLTDKPGPFTKENYQHFQDIVEKLKSVSFFSLSHLIQEQSLSIIDAFKMESGYWYVCRADHVYNIDQADNGLSHNKCPVCTSKRHLT